MAALSVLRRGGGVAVRATVLTRSLLVKLSTSSSSSLLSLAVEKVDCRGEG